MKNHPSKSSSNFSKRDRSSFRYQKPNKARNSHHSKKAKNKDSKNKNISVLENLEKFKKRKERKEGSSRSLGRGEEVAKDIYIYTHKGCKL